MNTLVPIIDSDRVVCDWIDRRRLPRQFFSVGFLFTDSGDCNILIPYRKNLCAMEDTISRCIVGLPTVLDCPVKRKDQLLAVRTVGKIHGIQRQCDSGVVPRVNQGLLRRLAHQWKRYAQSMIEECHSDFDWTADDSAALHRLAADARFRVMEGFEEFRLLGSSIEKVLLSEGDRYPLPWVQHWQHLYKRRAKRLPKVFSQAAAEAAAQ